MQHLHPGGTQVGSGAGHHFIEALRAEGSTEDEQRGPIRVEPEVCARRSTLLGAIQRDDRGAHRHAHVRRAGDRPGDSLGHPRGEARSEFVGHACARIGLVDDDRHTRRSRGEVGGGGDVSAEAHDDIGLLLREDPAHLAHGSRDAGCDKEQVLRRLARHGHGGQRAQAASALGHEPGFQADRAADEDDLGGGILRGEGVREGERGLDVPRRASGGEQDLHRITPGGSAEPPLTGWPGGSAEPPLSGWSASAVRASSRAVRSRDPRR